MRQSQVNYSRQREGFPRLSVKEPGGCCERGRVDRLELALKVTEY